MAWLNINFSSKTLNMPVEMEVICPQKKVEDCKVVFLLHGAIGDRASWLLRSQIEYFASQRNLCVVMPSGKNYFYINTENGYNYMDFICSELPSYIKNMFYVSKNPKDWMIAGCSMGGYGALRCGIEAKDVFGYIGAFSAAVDMVGLYGEPSFVDFANTFGTKEKLAASNNNLFNIMNEAKDTPILMTIGKQDELYESNVRFYKEFKDKANISFYEKDGGHDWDLWNDSIKLALKWFEGEDCKEVF